MVSINTADASVKIKALKAPTLAVQPAAVDKPEPPAPPAPKLEPKPEAKPVEKPGEAPKSLAVYEANGTVNITRVQESGPGAKTQGGAASTDDQRAKTDGAPARPTAPEPPSTTPPGRTLGEEEPGTPPAGADETPPLGPGTEKPIKKQGFEDLYRMMGKKPGESITQAEIDAWVKKNTKTSEAGKRQLTDELQEQIRDAFEVTMAEQSDPEATRRSKELMDRYGNFANFMAESAPDMLDAAGFLADGGLRALELANLEGRLRKMDDPSKEIGVDLATINTVMKKDGEATSLSLEDVQGITRTTNGDLKRIFENADIAGAKIPGQKDGKVAKPDIEARLAQIRKDVENQAQIGAGATEAQRAEMLTLLNIINAWEAMHNNSKTVDPTGFPARAGNAEETLYREDQFLSALGSNLANRFDGQKMPGSDKTFDEVEKDREGWSYTFYTDANKAFFEERTASGLDSAEPIDPNTLSMVDDRFRVVVPGLGGIGLDPVLPIPMPIIPSPPITPADNSENFVLPGGILNPITFLLP